MSRAGAILIDLLGLAAVIWLIVTTVWGTPKQRKEARLYHERPDRIGEAWAQLQRSRNERQR